MKVTLIIVTREEGSKKHRRYDQHQEVRAHSTPWEMGDLPKVENKALKCKRHGDAMTRVSSGRQ